jgi:hypothetical protein
MNIPQGTILQLGQADNSYPFQNIVATNISGTDYVDGFPTTSTGTSLGQYFHLGIDGQGNKKTDILNVSGTSTGGFNFWTSNSTDAPILLATMTTDGIGNASNTNFLQLKENAGQLQLYDGDNYSQNYPNSLTIGSQSTGFQTEINSDRINLTQTELGTVTHQTTLTTPYDGNYNNALVCTGVNSVATITCSDSQPRLNITDNTTASSYLYKDHLQINSSGSQSNCYSDNFTINNGTYTCAQLYSSTGGILTLTDNTNTSVLSSTDLTFNGKSIFPALSSFNFTVDASPYSFPFVSTGELTPQSSFSITTTASSITLITPNISTDSLISATIYRDRVFSPLGVSLTTNSIVLTGDFNGTQTIYFSGIIFF